MKRYSLIVTLSNNRHVIGSVELHNGTKTDQYDYIVNSIDESGELFYHAGAWIRMDHIVSYRFETLEKGN